MTTVFAASLSSCKETDNEVEEFPNWQKTNEAYYDKKYAEVKQLVNGGAADWKVLRSWSLDDKLATHSYDYVLANVLNAGTGSGCPLYTDSVKVHYSGRLLPSTSYAEGYIFDQVVAGRIQPQHDETAHVRRERRGERLRYSAAEHAHRRQMAGLHTAPAGIRLV